jgi:hypothetical protein
VEFRTDAESPHSGALRLQVGAGGSLAFFEEAGEVTVAQASRRILTWFLDNVEKPEI